MPVTGARRGRSVGFAREAALGGIGTQTAKELANPQPAMMQTLSTSTTRQKATLAIAVASLALLLFPKWARFQQTHAFSSGPSQTVGESALPSVTGIPHDESGAIQQLQRQYASTSETENNRQTQVAAAVSKMLDLDRHREELGDRHLIILHQKEAPTAPQKLSILPH